MATYGKKIFRGNEGRQRVLDGILEVSKTVASTYGPKGRTAAFDKGGSFRTTKDGITVAKELKFSDEAKNFGAMLIKEAAGKSNFMGGDGSTSVTILTAELCKEAYKLLVKGIDINHLKEGFQIASDYVLNELVTYKHEIENEHDIFNIAKTSANNDLEIAETVKQAFISIGDNGIVTLADSLSRKGETAVKTRSGLEFDRGFLSSECINASHDQCILEEPNFLFSSEVLNDVEDLQLIIQPLQLNKKPIVIIAPDFSHEVMAWFRDMLNKKTVIGSLVLAPGVSRENINDNLIDLAVMTNAKIMYYDFELNDYKEEYLGTSTQVIINKDKTAIIGAHFDDERYNKHIEQLRAKVDYEGTEIGYSGYQLQTIKERIAKMTGGIATIYVGGITLTELEEKKDRYEDAVNAVRAALTGGFIPGGGTPLLRIAYKGGKELSVGLNHVAAVKAFLNAIKAPAKILINSSGADHESIIPEILALDNKSGYNSKEGNLTDMVASGIIDPYEVIKNSVTYATNMTEQFMSVETVIVTDAPNMYIESLDSVLNEDGIN